MHKFLVLFLLLSSSCSHISSNHRGLASSYEEDGIDLKGFYPYFDINEDQFTFRIVNLKDFDLKYKLKTSESITAGQGSTCAANKNDYSILPTGSYCTVQILRPENYRSLQNESISIDIKDKLEINEPIYFKDYNQEFCKSINKVVDTYHQKHSTHRLYSAWDIYKYANVNKQRHTSQNYNIDCSIIKRRMEDESFDIKLVYKYCQRNITNYKEQYLDQLNDFDMSVACEDSTN